MKTIKRNELMSMLGAVTKISNLTSERSGREVANQFQINFEHGYAFQSYDSLIAVICNEQIYLTSKHDYSATTSKYCTPWVGCDTKTRRKRLEDETYILIEN